MKLVPEETLDIVINARDYATATLNNVVGSLRGLGAASATVVGNIAVLTRELGLELPVLNDMLRVFRVLDATMRVAASAVKVYELLTHSSTAATIAYTIAQHGLNAALAVTVGLLTMGVGLGLAAASCASFQASVPSLEFGGVVQREGVYYLHPGEVVVPPSASVSSTHQTINVYFENRAPISGDIDREELLRDLGVVVADKVRRAGG